MKIVKALLGLVVLYVVVMGGSGLAIRAMLKGETGERLRAAAQRSLPVDVSISGGTFDLAKWFVFQPSLSFDDLRVANPDGFSAEPLLTAALVSADADLRSLLGDTLEIERIEIVEPSLLVESDDSGRTNIDALLAALRSGEEPPPVEAASEDGSRSLVIRGFSITDGSVRYTTPGKPPMTVKNLNAAVADFDPAQAFDIDASFDLFEEEAVHLAFAGNTGPFRPESAPATGKLTVDAALDELPEQFRVDNLGDFIVAPGAASRLTLDADLAGDLLDDFSGEGRVRFSDIQLGKADKPQLPLRGEAPVTLILRNALANPSWALRMPDAELSLGAGTWRGTIDLAQDGDRLTGRSRGSIRGVDVNEILTALTDSGGVLFGQLELDRYDLAFAGRDAEEIQDSFRGSGRLDLMDGKLAVFDTLKTIENKVNQVLQGEQSYTEGVTSFVRAGTNFEIADRRVRTPNLMLENDSASIGGEGSFGFDMDLDYDISSLITGPLASALGGKQNAAGLAQIAAPLRVTGTVESPKVYLDVKSMARQEAVNRAKGFLSDLLNRGSADETAPEGEAAAAETEGGEPAPDEAQPAKKRLPFGLGDVLDQTLGGRKKE